MLIQIDIREEFGLPFETRSHIAAFMCPVHNEVPDHLYCDRRPENFWLKTDDPDRGSEASYRLILPRPQPEITHSCDGYLEHLSLSSSRTRRMVDGSHPRRPCSPTPG